MKLQRSFSLLFLLLLFTVAACAKQNDGAIEKQAWAAIHNGALLVDVRTKQEYDAGHLKGALLIPYDQIEQRITEFGEDKNRTIVVYCRSGRRAGVAEQTLHKLGFKNVLNAGGYEAMKAAK
ncbi:MAG TPA: rhodanese-like domain-containing protein [Gammaproteobacteria bacterium]|nr:rhodanese-like domain-containing protein [Gammaproteobacteria bacterium]